MPQPVPAPPSPTSESFRTRPRSLALLGSLLLLLLLAVTPRGVPGQYYLYGPLQASDIRLIDRSGDRTATWPTPYVVGNSLYLLENGDFLFPGKLEPPPADFNQGGFGGVIVRMEPTGRVVWEYGFSTPDTCQHHDIEPMPDGNVLILAWERRTRDEAIAAGRDPDNLARNVLWPERIVEVRPIPPDGAEIVWEWRAWDHLIQDFDDTKAHYGVVADHPRRIDINYGDTTRQSPADWLHANAIAYHADLDQIAISVRTFSEVWIIDHSTTTAEAASSTGGLRGHGGDLLWRWGNPQAYRRGTAEDRQLFDQHDVRWIAAGMPGAGNLTVFNNGFGRPGGNASSIDDIAPPVDGAGNYADPGTAAWGPAAPVTAWFADPPESFYGDIVGGAVRLADGSTVACEGREPSRFVEFEPGGPITWEVGEPSRVFRVERLEGDDPRLRALLQRTPKSAWITR